MDAASTRSDAEALPVDERPPGPLSMRETTRRLGRYVRPHRWTLAAAIALFFASSAIDPLVPALFKWLIDNGFKPTADIPFWTVPVVIVGLFTVRGALAFAGAYLFGRATANAV